MILQRSFSMDTHGRGTYEMTHQVQMLVQESGIRLGVVNVSVHHTSASLILCENADPAVRRDLEVFMARLAPDGAPWLEHDDEGPDDMPAHIRALLTGNSLTVPVTDGRCTLGTWQGLYLWEHRQRGHNRRITVTVQGENPAG